MDIQVTDFVAGARDARGVAVIIDVFRAATLQCQAIGQGATRILPVADEATARRFKETNPDWLLVGERHARKLPGFDYGNSPSEIAGLDLTGRTLIHTTHAGTQGLAAANDALVVLSAALVNASATVRRIRQLAPTHVTLVRMGKEAHERSLEDDICAEWLECLLRGKPYDTLSIRERLAAAPSAQKFFDPQFKDAPRADFDLCVDLDRFGFALQLDGRQSASPWLAARAVS
jgi:2-phosphosulfolactate phosphatase